MAWRLDPSHPTLHNWTAMADESKDDVKRSGSRAGWVVMALVVGYPLSYGPAVVVCAWLARWGVIRLSAAWKFLDVVYFPVIWFVRDTEIGRWIHHWVDQITRWTGR